ncbi:MAG: orotidine-5'-phosphate decarboxylase [Pseudomonadota bacterium]|nr:orotidine-5'-phosphate decarboxylase [Pseudomonadota bacterium]
MAGGSGTSFGTRLADSIRSTGTPLCMGIDPHPGMVPALFGSTSEPGHPDTIRAISDFTMSCLEAARGRVAAIKPQAAFFEAQGHEGMRVLAELGRAAIDSGMLVIMDAKRNDIGSTNAAYAEAWIGHDAPFPSDALTVNAFLGLDTLGPLLARADAAGAGLFVLTRTSNPGAGDLQDLDVGGKPLFHRLAEQLAPLAAARCDEGGRSSLGIVAGATWPQEARALRAILPGAPFLVPGFGAQGGAAADALAGLTREGDGWQGGLINSTRGLIFPKAAHDAGDIATWRAAIDDAVTASRSALAGV